MEKRGWDIDIETLQCSTERGPGQISWAQGCYNDVRVMCNCEYKLQIAKGLPWHCKKVHFGKTDQKVAF